MQAQKLTDAEKARIVNDHAAQTTGSETFYRYRHGLIGCLIHTQGVQVLAETCGAHWLIDAVASYQTSRRVQAEDFQVWTFKAFDAEGRTVLTLTNGNDDHAIVEQVIEFTDFPRELLPFVLWCERSGPRMVLMLPQER